MHRDLSEGKREIEDLVSEIRQEKDLRSLKRDQKVLWNAGYALGGSSITIIAVVGLVVLCLIRKHRTASTKDQSPVVVSTPIVIPPQNQPATRNETDQSRGTIGPVENDMYDTGPQNVHFSTPETAIIRSPRPFPRNYLRRTIGPSVGLV